MPPKQVQSDEIDFIMKMQKLKYSNCEIARKLDLSEGTIRYRVKRAQSGLSDMRKHKPSCLNRFDDFIKTWIEDYKGDRHRPRLKLLYEILRDRHGFTRSYDAVRRYVGKHYPEFTKKSVRVRIETPPGALLLVDWKEDLRVQLGEPDKWMRFHALTFTLGFSRKSVVIYSEAKDLDSFIRCHQEAFRKLGGLPEMIRTDCLKSAVIRWKGRNSDLNIRYKSYLDKKLRIDVFPSRPGMPTDKGKVEKRILDLFSRLDLKHSVFKNISDLQERSDLKLKELEGKWRCGATGLSVEESFSYEQKHLSPLPVHFPSIPVKERITRVRNDGTVFFYGNYYQVGREYIDKDVLCIHTGSEILVYRNGREIERFMYLPLTRGLVMLSANALADQDIKISSTVRQWGLEVARRQVDIYDEIRGGMR